MLRLIKEEKLVSYKYKANGVSKLTDWQQGWNDAIDAILSETPIIDFEPVVRCKDCESRHDLRCYHKRSSLDNLVGENDFCSWGKRRKDE